MLRKIFIFFFLLATITARTQAQDATATIKGRISDSLGLPLQFARVVILGTANGASADMEGNYTLTVPANTALKLEYAYFDGPKKRIDLQALQPGEVKLLDMTVERKNFEHTVAGRQQAPTMKKVDPSLFAQRPSTTGGIEDVLKITGLGISSNNELSSSYSVRGGNYDENLVYINDIEIYRPQLVRSGQQEGLSIINGDMVKELQFSSGGFAARYGDKLSSVLDITYKEPDSFSAKISGSLLGAFANLEGRSPNGKFRYLMGSRYRSYTYLLNSLDVQGDYKPVFADGQVWLSYEISPKLKLGYLGYAGFNRYLSIPQSQETTFGTVTSVIRLKVFFDGQEILRYQNFLNGLTLNYDINDRNGLKFIASTYTSDERELFDVIGQYRISQVESDLASEDFGNVVNTLGIGGYLNHGRNVLNSLIYNGEIKGNHTLNPRHQLNWGIKYQHEQIQDKLSEYRYIDSADYSIPQTGRENNELRVYEYIYSRNDQSWDRYMGYAQHSWNIMPDAAGYLVTGARLNYWNYNQELLVSPRVQFYFEPNASYNSRILARGLPDSLLKRRVALKVSGGVYSQPPFYRELRSLSGQLNPEIRAQKSLQLVAGGDVDFTLWDRPFKFTTEAYYKHLTDVIPYEIDNVRIRYYADNIAKAYATGIDLQLNGDIVGKNNPSWISLSLLKTAEDILTDSVVTKNTDGSTSVRYPGFIPRPTDQRFRFALYFQDYLPSNPTYRVHLNAVYASRLPYGPPDYQRYKDTLRVPPYRRVDIGFSKMLYDRGYTKGKSRFMKNFRSVWLSLEVFNLFQINNTVAYLWVKDTQGSDFAVPRYLTTRRVNLHLEIKF